MVQVFLGVVLGQAFLRYGQAVANGFDQRYRTGILGLIFVFTMALGSWMALARRVAAVPYDSTSLAGAIRFYADVAAVCTYAVMLVSLQPTVATSSGDSARIELFVWCVPVVYLSYLAASLARRRQVAVLAGLNAPLSAVGRPLRAGTFAGSAALVATAYSVLTSTLPSGHATTLVDQITLSFLILMSIAYRIRRRLPTVPEPPSLVLVD
jgi:hypothetical protein